MVFKVRGDHENAGYIKSLDRLTASNHKIEREVDEKKCGPIIAFASFLETLAPLRSVFLG